jgi:hypothetical protein
MVAQLIITLVGILSFPYILGFIWLILDYFILYKPLAEEVAADVEKPCLLLGIVQTILGGIRLRFLLTMLTSTFGSYHLCELMDA